LPLDAADGFVLSRVDGVATERELADLTGLPESQIHKSLEKLASLKVIDFGAGGPRSVPSKSSMRAVPQPAAVTPGGGRPVTAGFSPPASDPKVPLDSGHMPSSEVTAGAPNPLVEAAVEAVSDSAPELSEPVDLPLDLRRRILGLHSVLPSLDHYGLLAVGREADKKTVKRSYFELAGLFHPDRYFRKNLGSFKARMEAIFARTSAAYEVLSSKERRAEYDTYLADVEKARNVEAMLRNVMSEVQVAERSAIEQARDAVPAFQPASDPQPSSGPARPPASDGSSTYSATMPRSPSGSFQAVNTPPPAPSSSSSISEQLRREALAMRLTRGNRPVTAVPGEARRPVTRVPVDLPPQRPVTGVPVVPPGTAPVSPPSRTAVGEGGDPLRRRYEERVEAGRRHQGEKYVGLAQQAEGRNDLTAAAAAYRVALNFLLEDDPTRAHAREVIAKSEAALGETYVRQAQHEERASRWEDAVRSWGRAAKLRPQDPVALERYANALVKNGGDLHEASQHAQKAVSLAPTVPEYRCTLASVYLAAGLQLNARRELESAATQFPDSSSIQAMLKKMTKPA